VRTATTSPSLTDLAPSFVLSLRAGRRSPSTVQSHIEALPQSTEFLEANGMPISVADVHREHVESFIVS
jgi:hypothetical protein